MPSLFKDVEYYKKAAKESREKLSRMGITLDIRLSELIIDETNEIYSYVVPHYDFVKDEFAPKIQALNQEIREWNAAYKENLAINRANSSIDSSIAQGFGARLKRSSKENEQTAKEYEMFVVTSVLENADKVRQQEQLSVSLDSQIKEARKAINEIDQKGFLSKRLHKEEFASRKSKLYKEIDSLNKLKSKNECDLDTYKRTMNYYAKESEMIAGINSPLESISDYAQRYLLLNKAFRRSKYYADKANELEEQIKRLSAKDRFSISLLLLNNKSAVNIADPCLSDEYNCLDLYYMIYSLADSSAKEGIPEAQKLIEETLKQVSVEKDESRMMNPELFNEMKRNLFIIHALSFCGNETASALLKSILEFRDAKVSQLSAKIRTAETKEFDDFEERKSKMVSDIIEAAQRKQKEIAHQKYMEELGKPLPVTNDISLPEVEIVYVPNVDDM